MPQLKTTQSRKPETKLTAENHTTNKYGRKLDVAEN